MLNDIQLQELEAQLNASVDMNDTGAIKWVIRRASMSPDTMVTVQAYVTLSEIENHSILIQFSLDRVKNALQDMGFDKFVVQSDASSVFKTAFVWNCYIHRR